MRDKARIVEMICDMVRDVIPDIDGRMGTPTNKENLFFYSKELRERLSRAMAEDEFDWEGWRDFRSLVEDTFPEYVGCVFDNAIFLTPEEQFEIRERLKTLKEFMDEMEEAKGGQHN